MCRIFGIQLAVHATFFLLVAYVAWEGWIDAGAQHVPAALGSLVYCGYLLLFFTCVVLHELGHALVAKRLGIGVPRILLLPIGGMAEFDSIPRQPAREVAIALAGPAVNFLIAGLLTLDASFPGGELRLLFHGFVSPQATLQDLPDMGLAQELILMNILMGCFNLVPVFPMDGGRVLRALLATQLPYLKATYFAATLGKFLASAGAVYAVFVMAHIQLAVLLVFIFFAADMEYRMVRQRELEDERWQRVLARLYQQKPAPGTDGPTTPSV